jgi:hypothetical protein
MNIEIKRSEEPQQHYRTRDGEYNSDHQDSLTCIELLDCFFSAPVSHHSPRPTISVQGSKRWIGERFDVLSGLFASPKASRPPAEAFQALTIKSGSLLRQ